MDAHCLPRFEVRFATHMLHFCIIHISISNGIQRVLPDIDIPLLRKVCQHEGTNQYVKDELF